MRALCALLAILALVPAPTHAAENTMPGDPPPLQYDTGPDNLTIGLTVASFAISAANLIALTDEGSTGLGIAGIVIGASLAIYSSRADRTKNDAGLFVAIGACTAAIGVLGVYWADFELDDSSSNESVSFNREPWAGVQLIARW